MKTSSAKAKGRRCANEVKTHILRVYPSLLDDDVNITSSGETGEDLKLSPAARALFPYGIECKNVEKLNIWKAIEQAEGHTDYQPIVFFRRNRSKLYVVVEAEHFMELHQELREFKDAN